MKYFKYLLSMLVVISSLLLDACSFKAEILPTPTSLPPTPMPVSILSTETPILPTPITPTVTPTLISIREGTVYLLENFMTVIEDEDVRSVAFSPDGTVIAAAGGNADDFNIHLWDVATGQLVGVLGGHTDIVWGLAFSPDGKLLASASRDHQAIVYAWPEGEIVKILDFPSEVVTVSFSPDGQTLAVGGVNKPPEQSHTASIWTYSVNSWAPSVKLLEHINITAMAYSPNGDTLIGGGASRNIQVWRASDGASLFTLSHTHQVLKAVISPDGSTVATGTCITVSNDACVDGGVWLWDLPTGKLLKKLNGFPDFVENLAFSADGSLLIAGSRDGALYVYDTSTYTPIFDTISPDGISAMALSTDSGMLVTGNLKGEVHFWKNVYRP